MAPNETQYNEDELKAPEWLNTEFLTTILKNSENSENVTVLSQKITPGTVKGDHYASVMFRAVVQYVLNDVEKEKSLIIKIMPEADGDKKELLKQTFIFETEIGMYTQVIPLFEQILRGIQDDTKFCARCVYHSLQPRKLIVFEDLVQQGFDVLRNRFFELNEAKLAYEKLAKWQAISYKIALENPDYFAQYRHAALAASTFMQHDMITKGVDSFIDFLATQANLQKYKVYFENMKANLLAKCAIAGVEYRQNPQSNVAYVLCHGDFHLKNTMLKYNAVDKHLEDIMLLDFQFTFMGSWAYDLIYSKYFMISANLRANHFDELLYHYYTTFRDTLQKIEFKGEIPKLRDLQNELLRNKHLDFFLITSFLPMWLELIQEAPSVDDMMNSQDYRNSLYRADVYIEEINRLLPKLEHLGYFDD